MKKEIINKFLVFAIIECARQGRNKRQTARALGLKLAEYNEIIQAIPDYENLIERGKKEAPKQKVEVALLKRALGFVQEESCSENIIDRKTGELLDTMKKKTVSKQVAPDVRALLFWLKNRCPERWSDRPEESKEPLEIEFGQQEQML
ncbi:hypothetical protein P0136_02180 [Lentisphaerota bacterium ZTH]|nr:hypothetical protein JYG24_06680 [Lentisphaerota bacterium]WET06814.1 hypothetical protein P0136_02180 [Lentisphaerota bacterium ZTH]